MPVINFPKKSLGQNFLIDKNIIRKIAKIGNINQNKIILEIGSGSGNLTKALEELKPKKILAVEKDNKLSISLEKRFGERKKIEIINADIFNFLKKNNFEKNIIVFGNLPYNISTKILSSLILLKKWPPWYDMLILMFQKEVAERIIARSGTKEFGRLSILSNWRLEVKKHFDISKNCFFPKPKINSTLLSFKPKKNYTFYLKNPKNLEIVSRILFSNRRKMINKNFKKLFKNNDHVNKKLNIDLRLRPEQINKEIFYKIAVEYEKLLY
mgnify:CR=1 FL=1|tara:strand:- start:150 stop:956 length:807 start_codon:yes stop_codon:yes gene_type:complete